MAWYTNTKVLAALGGAAAVLGAQAVMCAPCVRKFAVKTCSRAILMKEQTCACAQSIKDDAEDLCAEARFEAQQQAEEERRMQEIEARVRAEVEAELKACSAQSTQSCTETSCDES